MIVSVDLTQLQSLTRGILKSGCSLIGANYTFKFIQYTVTITDAH